MRNRQVWNNMHKNMRSKRRRREKIIRKERRSRVKIEVTIRFHKEVVRIFLKAR
jgi:hypothetical protein